MATQVKIQEFGKHKQVMVSIPRAIAQLLGYTKGKNAMWVLDNGELKLKLED
ncbi:hypothetical protein HOD83_03775 [Candidatus Woesearchaeota archaeon]|jgi:hypothetical protein|nr:hypothetical protein [Candidatus Woesearchaeota archaeon]MBT4114551.1 hypothetical protein [Candidatus Woesearchaeota archaeon]MBT4248671.1 hypothetical protein [Candidatus Woesearchaeota archaeon]